MPEDSPPPPGWSPEETERITQWLSDKWGATRKCSQCDNTTWGVGDSPVGIPIASTSGGIILGPHYPCFTVFCTRCGNMVFINSLLAGIVSPKKEATNG